MTREEAENKIMKLAKEIREVVLEYYPSNYYFSMRIASNGTCIFFNNAYWAEDSDFPLDKWTNCETWEEEE